MGHAVPVSSPEARVVWRSGDQALTTCPVRAITPDARRTLRMFAMTHELVLGFGVAQFRLVRLPGAGAAGAQDARTMAELDYLRDAYNRGLLAETPKDAPASPRKRRP